MFVWGVTCLFGCYIYVGLFGFVFCCTCLIACVCLGFSLFWLSLVVYFINNVVLYKLCLDFCLMLFIRCFVLFVVLIVISFVCVRCAIWFWLVDCLLQLVLCFVGVGLVV